MSAYILKNLIWSAERVVNEKLITLLKINLKVMINYNIAAAKQSTIGIIIFPDIDNEKCAGHKLF